MVAAGLLLLCLTVGWETVSGQDHGVVFERMPPESGLSQSSVYAMIQDRRGFLWVGTSEGLNRYDGYQFVTYRHDPQDPNSLADNTVLALWEDRDGNLWVGTAAGLTWLDQRTGRFVRIVASRDDSSPGDGPNQIWQILQDRSGTIWAATSAGVCRVEPGNLRGRIYPAPATAQRLYEDHSGTLWVFDFWTKEARGHELDPTTDRFVSAGLTIPTGWTDVDWGHLTGNRTGTVWLSGPRGLATLDLSRRELHVVPNAPPSSAVLQTPDGVVWAGSTDISRYNPRTGIWQHVPLDMSGANALAGVSLLYRDRAGTLWVGTLGGLYRWDPHVRHFSHRANEPNNSNSLASSLVSAIHESSDGTLWVGTIGGGLNRLDRLTNRASSFRHNPRDSSSLSSDVVWVVSEDERGRLLIGTDDGLNVRDGRTGTFRVVRCESGADLRPLANAVSSIAPDGSGGWWLGMYGGALSHFDSRTLACQTVARVAKEISEPGSTAVHVDPAGSVWAGVEGYGLQRFDRTTGRFKQYPFDTKGSGGLTGRTVWAIHPGTDGFLWLGTDMGLSRFDPATETFTRVWDPALPSSVVYSIVEDTEGRLWLSTNRGLSSFDPTSPAGRQFESFTTADGLRNTEFNRRAALRSRSGELFFGGLQGLTSFDPSLIIRSNQLIPPVVLTELETRSRHRVTRVNPLGLEYVELSHRDYSFSFSFVALSFTNATKNRYVYMLEGFEPDWVGPTAERLARYTNVPPGSYVFRVKGSNNDGVWNDVGASLRVVIIPPFWQRGWFRGLMLAGAAGLLVFAHRYRVRQIIAIERIRRQVAIDLHDDVGSGLSQVAILSEVAKRGATPAAAALMTETATLARALRESMSDIVWAVDPRRDRLADLVTRMRQAAFNSLEADGLRVEFHGPADSEIERVGLTPDRRRHLLLIFKEAITNVARHARASHVRIELFLQRGILRLVIQDDGRGFDLTATAGGHGLENLSRRVTELQGQLSIDSSPGRGTTIHVSAPLR